MAWPITAFGAPNFDSGFVTLPSTLTNVPNGPGAATAAWLLGATFTNKTAGSITVTLNDGGGKAIVGPLTLAAGETRSFDWEFLPVTGTLQWNASAATSVDAKAWGYI